MKFVLTILPPGYRLETQTKPDHFYSIIMLHFLRYESNDGSFVSPRQVHLLLLSSLQIHLLISENEIIKFQFKCESQEQVPGMPSRL